MRTLITILGLMALSLSLTSCHSERTEQLKRIADKECDCKCDTIKNAVKEHIVYDSIIVRNGRRIKYTHIEGAPKLNTKKLKVGDKFWIRWGIDGKTPMRFKVLETLETAVIVHSIDGILSETQMVYYFEIDKNDGFKLIK